MDSDSFYYSMTYDLTNSVQRQGDSEKSDLPLWKQVWRKTSLQSWMLYLFIHLLTVFILCEKVDDRFFWNKHMIQDIIDLQVTVFSPSWKYRYTFIGVFLFLELHD